MLCGSWRSYSSLFRVWWRSPTLWQTWVYLLHIWYDTISRAVLRQLMILCILLSQRTLLAGWFSIRWRGTPPTWETQENWHQTFPLRPCLNSLIPKRTSARQSSATLGTWGTGKKRTPHSYKLGRSLGLAKSGCHHLVCRAGTWSRGPSRSSATITHSRGTTHCGWMLEWFWPNIHLWSLTPTPWMCKSWVSQSVIYMYFFYHYEGIILCLALKNIVVVFQWRLV